jgi:outer membrane lipoprotein SlyB
MERNPIFSKNRISVWSGVHFSFAFSDEEIIMQTAKIIIALSLVTFLLGGCTPDRSTKIYTSKEALQAEDVEEGIVESVESAIIRKDGTIVGTTGGGIIGGIAGSTVGGGKGQQIASTVGVILGGWLGDKIEKGVTDLEALKIVVKLNSGQKIVIVQEADVPFEPGERVNVFSSRVSNTKRVSKL